MSNADKEYEYRDEDNYGRPEYDWACAVAAAAEVYRDAVDLRDLLSSAPRTDTIQVGPFKFRRVTFLAQVCSAADAAKEELDRLLADDSNRGYVAFEHSKVIDSDGHPKTGHLRP